MGGVLEPLRIGLVGYACLNDERKSALALLNKAIEQVIAQHGQDREGVILVLNMIHTPIANLGSAIATRHGWRTKGVIRHGHHTFSGDVDECAIAHDDWAEQLATNVDVLIRLGGKSTAVPEMNACHAQGKPVLEFDLIS